MKYEVQTYTLCDGFINTWSDDDEGPVQFDTQAQAQAEAGASIRPEQVQLARGVGD